MQRNPFLRGFGQAATVQPAQTAPAMLPPGYPGVPSGPSGAFPPGLAPALGGGLEGILDPQLDGSDYFFYACDPGSIANGGTGSSQIQIDAGTDFLWIATTYQSNLAASTFTLSSITVPLMTLTIQDTGATKNLMNTPVPLNCIAGTGEFPYRLIEPRLFRANSTINFTWTNYSGSETYAHTYFVMHGIRKIAGSFNLS